MTEVFCWCSLNLEKFWFYIRVVVLWLNFTAQMTLCHLLPMAVNKILERKDHQIYSKMLRRICKRVTKNLLINVFLWLKLVLKPLKILWWRFLVPRSEHLLVSSATLSCKTQNIFTLSMLVPLYYNTNSFFIRSFSLCTDCWSVPVH